MRTWIVVVVAVLVGVLAFTVPIRSQEQTRVGAVIDVTALTTRLDAMKPAMEELKKQNEELQKMQKRNPEWGSFSILQNTINIVTDSALIGERQKKGLAEVGSVSLSLLFIGTPRLTFIRLPSE